MSKNSSLPNIAAPLAADARLATASVSVVIVVWNAQKYVMECLESLQQHCGKVCTEVIVVDNASTDGTPDLVAERFPEFTLIRNSENAGFAQANNIGIKQASGDFICLVNSDVKFTNDCISPMLDYLRNTQVAMVGPKMLSADGEVRRSTMRFPTVWNNFSRALGLDLIFPHSRLFGGLLMADFDHQRTTPVEVLNGWFLLLRRSAVDRVGLLDPQFFMYGEDVDWCYRFREAGEKIVFFADASAIHYGGASSSNAPLRFYLELYRATLQYWRKHRGWLPQQMYLLNLGLYHSGRVFGFACSYLFLPSRRESTLLKMKRSFACLRWIAGAMKKREASGRSQTALSSEY
jgi:GT2 family glycosyltransferase